MRTVTQLLIFVGLILLLSFDQADAQPQVTIDEVTGTRNDTTLAPGETHSIKLRFDVTGAPGGRTYQPANGFIIYSPDGADWGSVQGTLLAPFNSIGFDLTFNSHFNKTGNSGNWGLPQGVGGGNAGGADTVGVLIVGLNQSVSNAMAAGFNDVVYEISFASSVADFGKHICIDTSTQVPGAAWEWANADGLLVPDWSDSQCWVITCCEGTVGDVNGSGGPVTVSDIGVLVDFLFISGTPLPCLEEADVDRSALNAPPLDGADITVSDIGFIVDHLFISGAPMAACP